MPEFQVSLPFVMVDDSSRSDEEVLKELRRVATGVSAHLEADSDVLRVHETTDGHLESNQRYMEESTTEREEGSLEREGHIAIYVRVQADSQADAVTLGGALQCEGVSASNGRFTAPHRGNASEVDEYGYTNPMTAAIGVGLENSESTYRALRARLDGVVDGAMVRNYVTEAERARSALSTQERRDVLEILRHFDDQGFHRDDIHWDEVALGLIVD